MPQSRTVIIATSSIAIFSEKVNSTRKQKTRISAVSYMRFIKIFFYFYGSSRYF